MEERLRAQWQAAIRDGHAPEAVAPRPQQVEDALDRLLARHREPHRRYHTVTHVAAALDTAEDLLAQVDGADGAAVRLALCFHDAIYDPQAAAGAAIMATADHRLPPDRSPTTAVVLDADLAILAAEPARYEAYVIGVRAEYAHVDDEGWRTGRAAVLAAFLDRPVIFVTAPMRASEHRARANLAAELSRLRAGA